MAGHVRVHGPLILSMGPVGRVSIVILYTMSCNTLGQPMRVTSFPRSHVDSMAQLMRLRGYLRTS